MLPLAALAAYTRFRLRQQSRRVYTPRPWQGSAADRPAKQPSADGLAWMHLTFARRRSAGVVGAGTAAGTSAEPVRTCPSCRYELTEPAAFCRRCGTRLYQR
jgi:hypothetical protein